MGNLFTSELNNEVTNDYMSNLRRWEREIKVNNLKRNSFTNNGPDYIKNLKLWSDDIKMNNFIINNNTNNPPDYIKNLQLRNQFLENELNKINNDFKGLSIV